MALLRTLRCPRGAISTTSMYQYQGSGFDHDLIAGSLSRLLSFNCSVNCFPPFRFAAQNYPAAAAQIDTNSEQLSRLGLAVGSLSLYSLLLTTLLLSVELDVGN